MKMIHIMTTMLLLLDFFLQNEVTITTAHVSACRRLRELVLGQVRATRFGRAGGAVCVVVREGGGGNMCRPGQQVW